MKGESAELAALRSGSVVLWASAAGDTVSAAGDTAGLVEAVELGWVLVEFGLAA